MIVLADDVCVRHDDAVQLDRAAAGRAEAAARDPFARDAVDVERDEETGDAVLWVVARSGEDDRRAGDDREAGARLLSVEAPAAVDPGRASLDVAGIAAGGGLGEREANRCLAAERRNEPLLLHFGRRVLGQDPVPRVRGEEREAEIEVAAGELLHDDSGLDARCAAAALRTRYRHAPVAPCAGLAIELPEEVEARRALEVPVVDRVGERPHLGAQRIVLGREEQR
jgi:hypothetical protein